MEKEKIFVKNPKEVIDVGRNISLEILSGNYMGVYYSYVFDEDQKYFYILLPTDQLGRAGILRVGDNFLVSCISKKGLRLGFDSKIVDIIKDGEKTLYKIEKPKEFYKIEFRDSFRVYVLMKAKCLFFDSKAQTQTTGCSILNLSANGAKISLGAFLELNKPIIIEFVVDNKTFSITSTIARRSEIDKLTYHYGIKFNDLESKDREILLRFCLKKQMETLRMQKG